MDLTDGQLIRNYIAGDETSFEILLDRHLRPVYNFIYRMCRNKEDTEDIIQETFFKVWKNIRKYHKEESFKAWLFTIARNTAIDLLRKKKNFVFSDLENDDGSNNLAENIADNSPGPDLLSENAEKSERLEKILGELPATYRQVMLLRIDNDLTFEEIGRVLNKSLNTVKSQYRRALLILHQNEHLDRIK